MALKELFARKGEKYDEFDNPNALEREDCLSCRVVGKTIAPNFEAWIVKANAPLQAQLRLCLWVDILITLACNN